jgi:hypothetical protein
MLGRVLGSFPGLKKTLGLLRIVVNSFFKPQGKFPVWEMTPGIMCDLEHKETRIIIQRQVS